MQYNSYYVSKIIIETINHYINKNCVETKRHSLTEAIRNKLKGEKFKMWFGDWENDPENASKVVDEHGRPLVVYHGTTQFGKDGNPFTEFKYQKEGWNGGTNSPGYFTDNISVAKFFASSDSFNFYRNDIWQIYKNSNLTTVDDCISFLMQYFSGYRGYFDDVIKRPITTNDRAPKELIGHEALFFHSIIGDKASDKDERDSYIGYVGEDSNAIIKRLHESIKIFCGLASRSRYNKENKREGVVYPCYLSIKKPFVYDAKGKEFCDLDWEGFYKEAVSSGCDGMIIKRVHETTLYNTVCTDYIVFNPNQIKHAYECVDFSTHNDILK